jgi:hypothetical protein
MSKKNPYEGIMTNADYSMMTKNLSVKEKKEFDRGVDNTNALMSLGAVGLHIKRNESLSAEEINERRKKIPKFFPNVKATDITPYKRDKK